MNIRSEGSLFSQRQWLKKKKSCSISKKNLDSNPVFGDLDFLQLDPKSNTDSVFECRIRTPRVILDSVPGPMLWLLQYTDMKSSKSRGMKVCRKIANFSLRIFYSGHCIPPNCYRKNCFFPWVGGVAYDQLHNCFYSCWFILFS